MTDNRTHAVVETFDIYSNDAVEVFRSCALDGANVRNARVVDEDVNALLAEQLLKAGDNECLVGYIAMMSRSSATSGNNSFTSRGRTSFVYVQNANDCTMGCESQRDGLTNSTAAAGDYGDFAVQPKIDVIGGLRDQSDTPRFQGMKSS
jgi:hypothetical protein